MFETFTEALGLAVVHFIWQGALWGVLGAIVLRCVRTATTRYAVACAAMMGCALTFVATVVVLLTPASVGAIDAEALAAPRHELFVAGVAWLWAGGVVFFFVRFALQWASAHRLRTAGVSEPDEHWRGVFDALVRELGLRRSVRLLRSTAAEAPMVVGWLSPVVLVPASAFAGLTPEQLRAVLTHELSHIRRHDHVINAVQVCIETVLFFHPVVWWLSGRVRLEREHCCDDAAVALAGNARVFAEALAQLESLRLTHSRFALAANGGSLMDRITRIMGSQPERRMSSRWRTVAALAAGVVVAAAGIAHASQDATAGDIEQGLRDAVTAGLSEEKAHEIYETVVLPGSEAQQKMDAHLAEAEKKIAAAVDAGKLSAKDGEKKLAGMRRGIEQRQHAMFLVDVLGVSEKEAHVALERAEVTRAVDEGELTEEEAERKMASIKRRAELHEQYKQHITEAGERTRAGVASGDMTEEQGRTQMAALKKGVAQRMMHAAVSEDIEAAVEAGKITREEGEKKMATLSRKMEVKAHRGERERLEQMHRRIEGAVERGDMTREEADAKYAEIHERMAREHGHEGDFDWKAVRTRIEGAVERGDMTREEADAKYKELHEQMAGEHGEGARGHDDDGHGEHVGDREHDGDHGREHGRDGDAAHKGDGAGEHEGKNKGNEHKKK